MMIMTRKEAFEQKSTRYFTGKPCKNGHYAERYVTTGSCSACLKSYTNIFRGQKKPVADYRHKYVNLPYINESDLAALMELSQALLAVSGPPPFDAEAALLSIYGEAIASQLGGKV